MTRESGVPPGVFPGLFSGIDIGDQSDDPGNSRRAHRELAAHQLRATGLSVRRIAEALDVPQGLVVRWLSDTPAVPTRLERPEPPQEPVQEQMGPAIDADALVALRTQFRACMAQVRGLADRINRVDEREQQRAAALEKALEKLQGTVDEQMADLRAQLQNQAEALRAALAEVDKRSTPDINQPEPAAAKRPRLSFWRRRGE